MPIANQQRNSIYLTLLIALSLIISYAFQYGSVHILFLPSSQQSGLLTPANLMPLVGSLGVVGLAGFLFHVWSKRLHPSVAMIISIVFLVGTGLVDRYVGKLFCYGGFVFFIAVVVALVVSHRVGNQSGFRAFWPWPLIALCLCVINYRWNGVAGIAAKTPPAPDAQSFMNIMSHWSTLFDTAHREPLYLWLWKTANTLFASNLLSIQLMNTLFMLASFPLMWRIGNKLSGPMAGIAAIIISGSNATIAIQSARGLRNDAYIFFLLLVINILLVKGSLPSWRRAIALGIASGLAALLQMSALPTACLLFIWLGWRQRWKIERLLVAFAIMFLLIAPHLANNLRISGDLFYSVNYHARFYRNLEFGGKPGFPTKAEIQKNSYAGPAVTMTHYVFREHTLANVIQRHIKGLSTCTIGKVARGVVLEYSFFLMIFYLVGLTISFCPRHWNLLALLIIASAPFVFLAGSPVALDPRLIVHIAPCLGFILGTGLQYSMEYLAKANSRPSQSTTV